MFAPVAVSWTTRSARSSSCRRPARVSLPTSSLPSSSFVLEPIRRAAQHDIAARLHGASSLHAASFDASSVSFSFLSTVVVVFCPWISWRVQAARSPIELFHALSSLRCEPSPCYLRFHFRMDAAWARTVAMRGGRGL